MNLENEKEIRRAVKKLQTEMSIYDPNEVRVMLALERAVARLASLPELTDHLVFKGGFVLLKYYDSPRFTRDVDALAVSISKKDLCDRVEKALQSDLDDCFWFGDIKHRELTEQGEYGAYRFDCAYQVGSPKPDKIHKLSRIHIDIGFSDHLPSLPKENVSPSLLTKVEPLTWKIYPAEFIVAEKLQTLMDRGSENSRAKDVFDLNYLFPKCKNKKSLITAIKQTFKNRGTDLPDNFAKQAKAIDLTLLSSGWRSVQLIDAELGFEEAWGELMEYLRVVDEIKAPHP
jgi:predicted nucleotidyltransferase component of viral defense system